MLERVRVEVYLVIVVFLLLFGGGIYSSGAVQESIFYDWDGYVFGLVAPDDGRSLNVISGRGGTGSYVSVTSGGVGYGRSLGGDGPVFEISNGNIRVSAHGYSWGDWVSIFGSGFSQAFHSFWGLGIETSYGRIRLCVWNWYDDHAWYEWWNCGNWITLHPCPNGYNYNPSTGKCEATPIFSCPSGFAYNYSTRKCEMSAQITYTCPLGQYPCIYTGSNYYCSPYQCVDIETPNNVQTSDTIEGANDKHDDGPRDSVTGKCNGIVRIFNGQDLRCRPPGIDTFWTLDCCKKDKNFIFKCNNSSEQMLAKLRTTIKYRGQDRDYTAADANCHYVGSYCSKKIKFIGCVQKKKTYCCFSSPLARIIQEQGRPQLGKGWGDPKNPDCSGFTIDEFQKLDFSKIDFSEWVNMIVGQETSNLRNSLPGQTQQMQQNIQNMYR